MCLAFVVGGCVTVKDQPARITDYGPQGQRVLTDVLRDIFQRDVVVAPDALMTSDILQIEMTPRRGIGNAGLAGRVMTAPIRFSLVKNRQECVLVDQRNGNRFMLDGVRCMETG